jgi:hypothetical protein
MKGFSGGGLKADLSERLKKNTWPGDTTYGLK